MDLKTSGKFCPICKHKNPHTASICGYCGALLEDSHANKVDTTKNTGEQLSTPIENGGAHIDFALIPEDGIGIYIEGIAKPYYLHIDKELIIGRKLDVTSEAVLDLSDMDAFNLGLSRRHAMICRKDSGYEIVDLASTNGTWLNTERLIPNKPYPFASGSQLRLGRMLLFVLYRYALQGAKRR